MRIHPIVKIVFSSICLTGILGGCQAGGIAQTSSSFAQVNSSTPNYAGSVRKISTPIVIRFRPYPKSRTSRLTTTLFTHEGKRVVVDVKSEGHVHAENSSNGVSLVISLDTMIAEIEGQSKRIDMPMELRAEFTDRGKLVGMDFDMPTAVASGKKPSKKELQEVFRLFQALFPILPEKGVRSGDDIFSIKQTYSQGISTSGINISVSGIVRGITWHRGRESILVDYNGALTMSGQSMRLTGYGVMDTNTAAWVYSDLIMHPQVGPELQGYVREVGSIYLPSGSGKTGVSFSLSDDSLPKNNVTARERLVELKHLLDTGLITEDEAREKRAEILKDL